MKENDISGKSIFLIVIMIFFTMNSMADEVGFAIGVNTSMYKPWYENSFNYQKVNIFNPVEITYQKNFCNYFGIHTGLQYSKKSISESLQNAGINQTTGRLESTGEVKFEIEKNYISLEISPIIFYRVSNIIINGRLGLCGEFYINEWNNNFGGKEITSRIDENNPFVLSFAGGIGIGYIIKEKFKIGLRSSVSRTLTDIYKEQKENTDIAFLNFHNVITFGFLF